MLCARELATAGVSVTLLERDPGPGRQSSWAGGGILSPLYPWRYPAAVQILAAESQRIYPGLTQTLTQATGIDSEWTPSGLLMLDAPDRRQAVEWAVSQSLALSAVEAAEATRHEPQLDAHAVGRAVWMPDIAQLRNPRLMAALAADLVRLGVELRTGAEVTGLVGAGGRLRELRLRGGTAIAASQCVVAAGAWSGDLLAPLGLPVPVTPVRGQMMLLHGPVGALRRILLKDYHYIIPRRDGHVLVGSTLEHVGFDIATTDAARQELREAAYAMVPALRRHAVVGQWAGLRPGSPTGVPYIGEHPGMRGVFVCTGHYRNGIVLAPASAALLADLVLGRSPRIAPEPYRLGRPDKP